MQVPLAGVEVDSRAPFQLLVEVAGSRVVVERVFGAHLPDGLAGLLLPGIARGGGGRGDHLNGAGGFFRGLLQSRKAAFLLDEDVRLRQKLLGGGEGLSAIAAVPADGGDHLRRDPFAEGLGLGLVRAEDDIVKTGFVDDVCFTG